MSAAGPGAFRCATSARVRSDPLLATAPPARRLFLVEVPGPWGRTALTDSRLDRYASGRLADAADQAGVRVLLVRRPGRHPAPPADAPRSWALVDTRPGRAGVRWGTWRHEHDLLEVDLTAAVDPAPARPLALVCTHGRHDVCCALRGRPVVTALAEATDRDVWECSHLGGDRFAANVLLLPDGELFGNLDPASAVTTVEALGRGRVSLEHYRGRLGRPPVEQAAVHLAMAEWGEDRLGAVRVVGTRRSHEVVHARAAAQLGVEADGEGWTVDLEDGDHRRHRLTLVTTWTTPERLTCSAGGPASVRRFLPLSLEPLPA